MLLLASWLFRLSTLHLSLRILFPPITQFNLPNSPKNKQNWPLFSTPASTAPPSGPVSCHQPCLDLPTGLHASFHPSPRPLSTQCSFQNPGGSVSIGNHQWRLKSLDNSLADSKPPLIRGKTDFHRWKKKNPMEIISRDESQQEADNTYLLLWYTEKAGLSRWFQAPSKTYASVLSGGN